MIAIDPMSGVRQLFRIAPRNGILYRAGLTGHLPAKRRQQPPSARWVHRLGLGSEALQLEGGTLSLVFARGEADHVERIEDDLGWGGSCRGSPAGSRRMCRFEAAGIESLRSPSGSKNARRCLGVASRAPHDRAGLVVQNRGELPLLSAVADLVTGDRHQPVRPGGARRGDRPRPEQRPDHDGPANPHRAGRSVAPRAPATGASPSRSPAQHRLTGRSRTLPAGQKKAVECGPQTHAVLLGRASLLTSLQRAQRRCRRCALRNPRRRRQPRKPCSCEQRQTFLLTSRAQTPELSDLARLIHDRPSGSPGRPLGRRRTQ